MTFLIEGELIFKAITVIIVIGSCPLISPTLWYCRVLERTWLSSRAWLSEYTVYSIQSIWVYSLLSFWLRFYSFSLWRESGWFPDPLSALLLLIRTILFLLSSIASLLSSRGTRVRSTSRWRCIIRSWSDGESEFHFFPLSFPPSWSSSHPTIQLSTSSAPTTTTETVSIHVFHVFHVWTSTTTLTREICFLFSISTHRIHDETPLPSLVRLLLMLLKTI